MDDHSYIYTVDDPKVWDTYRNYIFKNIEELVYKSDNINFVKWVSEQPELDKNDPEMLLQVFPFIAVQLEDVNLFRDLYYGIPLTPRQLETLINYALIKERFFIIEWLLDNELFPPSFIANYIHVLLHNQIDNFFILLKLLNDRNLLDMYMSQETLKTLRRIVNYTKRDLIERMKNLGLPILKLLDKYKIENIDISTGTDILNFLYNNQLLIINDQFMEKVKWVNRSFSF